MIFARRRPPEPAPGPAGPQRAIPVGLADAPEPAVVALRERLLALPEVGAADRRALRDSLLGELEAPSFQVRALAAEALGRIGDERAIMPLVVALQDAAPLVRWRAAHALLALHVGALVAPEWLMVYEGRAFEHWKRGVLEALTAGLGAPDIAARRDAARSLAELREPSTLPALLRALFDDEPALRWQVGKTILALAGADPALGPQVQSGLAPFLHHGEPLYRQTAAELLGHLGHPAATAALLPVLHDPDAVVRWSACAALGSLATPAAANGLIGRLADDDPWVRAAAAAGLGRLGDPYAVAPLLQVAGDEQAIVRRAVLAALGQIGAAAAQPALVRGLRDRDPATRLAAVQALARLGDKGAIRPLSTLVRDRVLVAGVRIGQEARRARQAIAARDR